MTRVGTLRREWLRGLSLDPSQRPYRGHRVGLPAPLCALIAWVSLHRSALLDVAVALGATGIELGLLLDGSSGAGDGIGIALTIVAGFVLLLRRQFPITVLCVTAALAVAEILAGANPGGAPVLVAVYSVAELHQTAVSVAALLPSVFTLYQGSISSPPVTVWAWALGAYVQTRHRYLASLEERAATLERERDQLTQIATQQERVSIARELHDIVAHSVTVMLVGVRGARDVLRTAPEVAEQTLDGVEASAEQSIDELRRMLTLLRATGDDPDAELRPAPTLLQLDELVGDYRRAGMPVELTVEGTVRPLPGGVELSVHRIVEEGLTNVLKHARPTAVSVLLRYGAQRLSVEIRNDHAVAVPTEGAVTVPTEGVTGHGLLGMRERVAALDGRLEAGPRPDGGFALAAEIPIEAAS